MEPLFEGLTESELDYLKILKERGYFDGIDLLLMTDASGDYRYDKLLKNGYIREIGSGPYSGSVSIETTGKGNAALIDYSKYHKKARRSSTVKFLSWLLGTLIAIATVIISILQLLQSNSL